MDYSFTLKDNNQKAYRIFNWFLFFLHLIVAAVFALNTTNSNNKISLYVLLGFYVAIGIVYYFLKYRNSTMGTFSLILALLYANFWSKYVSVFAMLLFIAVYLFATLLKRTKTTVSFSINGGQLSRLYNKALISWHELDNVVLKDNLLTIDYKNNKIMQFEIIDDKNPVDEKTFNLYCAEKINFKD